MLPARDTSLEGVWLTGISRNQARPPHWSHTLRVTCLWTPLTDSLAPTRDAATLTIRGVHAEDEAIIVNHMTAVTMLTVTGRGGSETQIPSPSVSHSPPSPGGLWTKL